MTHSYISVFISLITLRMRITFEQHTQHCIFTCIKTYMNTLYYITWTHGRTVLTVPLRTFRPSGFFFFRTVVKFHSGESLFSLLLDSLHTYAQTHNNSTVNHQKHNGTVIKEHQLGCRATGYLSESSELLPLCPSSLHLLYLSINSLR